MTDIFDIAWKGSLELTENKIVGKVLSEGLNYGDYICLSDYIYAVTNVKQTETYIQITLTLQQNVYKTNTNDIVVISESPKIDEFDSNNPIIIPYDDIINDIKQTSRYKDIVDISLLRKICDDYQVNIKGLYIHLNNGIIKIGE